MPRGENDRPAQDFSLETMRRAFASRADPYTGVYAAEPRRIGGVISLLLAAIALPLAIAAPPTEAIGDAGWIVWGLCVAATIGTGIALIRPGSRVGFDGMLAVTYFGIAVIALLTWLAGGLGTPYQQLYLAPGVLPPSIHPPRRALSILALVSVAIWLPLAYDGWNASAAATIAVELFFILMLALITMVVINAVREQRLGLLTEGEAANRLARSDALTGLGNRLAFDETLDREIARSRRSGAPMSMLILDLDGFKQINDSLGHPVGDQILRGIASAMRTAVRIPDACFRWGGDEFALLLPETSRDAAVAVGERLREQVREHAPLPGGGAAEFSFGVAQLRAGDDGAQLVRAADQELVEAKRADAARR